ncbi:DsbE family thiol:disulfide interchange protein [Haematobacter massiliensis]|uniref:Thiol:disulfide interchange protein n=1 Tax=Haematobacter massiliensis TaxID=195105 RepID=A0A086YCX3_9RHOB|nr:DsbE family thiol:disulfide interchange protein [Haematobacter massiliensis]KFI32123.1 thiol:disulfide interchange protein [Haematobacter massiliensis]OWJ72718.1 DsbE family thiol:disulfide interchange protein [Haematobacter massiliensis]OWJ85762.1 DsbE family thiol:disulfide interchange protein [Haematobacter massiliensis]QBJ24503.1 DsbE family thiol:disulfide interchange protein [Haematobacter massiliensis]
MARISPLVLIPPVAFAGLAALFFFGMGRDDTLPSTLVGREAPAIAVTPLGPGASFDTAVLKTPGVKLVNFWASWCAPCRAEHPMLERLAAEGVPIYGINYKDDPAKALAFLQELGDPFHAIGADASGRMALDWGVYGVPETYVIDSAGKVVMRFAGPITAGELDRTLRPAIQAAR